MFFVSDLLQQICNTIVSAVPIAPVDSLVQEVCSAIIGVLRNFSL